MSSTDTPSILTIVDGVQLQSSSCTANLDIIQEGRQRSNAIDFMSQMPDELLVMILSLLPVKDAVATSGLSTRWRFLWCNLIQLNFSGSQAFHNKWIVGADLIVSERDKYLKQVNSVIQSYNHPMVQDFRIRFSLNYQHRGLIDKWLQFAVNKNVEFLELDLSENYRPTGRRRVMYSFPLGLFDKNLIRSNAMVVGLLSLKELILNTVNMNKANLQEILTNCPCLETLSIHYSQDLDRVCISGRSLNLKHLKLLHCTSVTSIYLSDFDLLSFSDNGFAPDLCLVRLPKLKEVDMIKSFIGVTNEVLGQISSCGSSLQSLSINIYRHINLINSLPELPNVKKINNED